MQRHLVLSTKEEFERIVSGEIKYLIRFFKKRQEFLNQVKSGDLVFLKVNKEIRGQFLIKKLILGENLGDWDKVWIENIEGLITNFHKEFLDKNLAENSAIIIAQIDKLEQLITSPIELPIIRKEWAILED